MELKMNEKYLKKFYDLCIKYNKIKLLKKRLRITETLLAKSRIKDLRKRHYSIAYKIYRMREKLQNWWYEYGRIAIGNYRMIMVQEEEDVLEICIENKKQKKGFKINIVSKDVWDNFMITEYNGIKGIKKK